ncbi:MAG TPA: class I SAM-dependent methyltransferase [Nocardioides sp.]|uniref:class I SAM-dependent methyltransferase n=1 Tax=Nocardioides sp. TaxID=35761 RepID=UPI002E32F48F|nr:class I SAM-dependent methyltransferase [Nocardioides sp.]HEX5086814.1 class I SAM-dependent methyltransferase [Nocardioides sp.]
MDRKSGYFCERWTLRNSREWVCQQATGRTLEMGFGTGLNLRWYPRDIRLVAVDPDPQRLEVSGDRARSLDRAVQVALADAYRLPFRSDTFDTVVCTLMICDVEDRADTLAETYRVIRPGGSLLLLDHLEPRWRHGRPATLGRRVGFALAERQRLWGGYFERVRLQKPAT